MREMVSVIILSYRNTQGIYETLESVLSQKYDNIELIISDDGTPGFSEELHNIEDYIEAKKNSNIKNTVINAIEVNGGTVKNINSAIKKARGKYIKILSSEDRFSNSDALDKYVEYMENTKGVIAFGKMRGVTREGEYKYELLSCESDYKLLKSYTIEDTRNRLFKRNFLPAPAWIADRRLFEENGLFPEDTRLIEDYPYWLYLSMKGVKFDYIDEVLIDYRLSGVSSGGFYGEMFMKDMLVIYNKYIFPYDRRFGIFQPVYNCLKRGGLNFYMSAARWDKMSAGRKILAGIKYFPFFILVKFQNFMNNYKNKRIGGKK
ncbi:MAG: glycosyltransferase [Lachnospiraceae bacterium]